MPPLPSEVDTADTYSRRAMIADIKALLVLHSPDVELFRELFQILRRRYSIRRLAKSLGVASPGHMTAIVNCEKYLGREKLLKISELVKLNQREERLLFLCHEIVKCRKNVDKESLIETFREHQKAASVRTVNLNQFHGQFAIALDVFAAIGIMKVPTTIHHIVELLPQYSEMKIESAMKFLRQHSAIECVESNRYIVSKNEIDFRPMTSGIDMRDFVRHFVKEAESKISFYASQRMQSCFESAAVTIKAENLPKIADALRELINDTYSKIEDTDGDSIIRINLQMYPISTRLKP